MHSWNFRNRRKRAYHREFRPEIYTSCGRLFIYYTRADASLLQLEIMETVEKALSSVKVILKSCIAKRLHQAR